MVTFCGKNESDLSVARGALANDCFVDGLNMIPHILFLLICIPILVIWNLSYYGKIHTLSWVHFQGHYLRWIITLILLFIHLCEIGEGVLSGTYLNEFRLHPIIPPCVALIGALFSIIFYHNVEIWNSSRFLLALLLYWSFALTTKGLKIKMMLSKGIGLEHLRLNLTMCVVIVYFIIILIELNVLRSQRYAFLRRPVRLHPSMEMVHIRYMHPYVNLLSKAVFWWVNEILVQGYKRPLEIIDLGLLPSDHQAQKQMNRLSYIYKEEMKKLKNPEDIINIWKVYFLGFWPMLVLGGVFKLISDLLSFVGPLAITGIINYVVQIQETPTSNSSKIVLNTMEDSTEFLITFGDFIKNGYVLAVIVFLVNVLQHTFLQTSFHLSIIEGIHIRAAIQGIVYQKALHMSSWSVTSGKTSFGQITNLVSVDTSNMMMLFFMGHYIWAAPLQILITLVLLYHQMGVSALIASTILILIVPVQYALANTLAKIQSKTLTHADERLKKTSEMLNGIKLLKLYGWEKLFCNLIEQVRFKEMACIKRSAICNIFINFITVSGPILVTLMCFGIYPFIEKENLHSSRVFSALALFNLLTIPLFMFPMLVKIIVNAKVSSHRLVKYMAVPDIENPSDLDDLQDSVVEFKSINGSIELHVPDVDFLHHSNRSSRRGSTVSTASRRHSNISLPENEIVHPNDGLKELLIAEIKGANLSWDLDSKDVELKNINLQIPMNKLTIVVGPVGSGKSSLLSALLGEMCTVSGSVEWERSLAIAYVPQTPWILNATFQDNILFGQAYDQQRYNRVVRACSLQADMDILPAGDKTEIGQKGVNLSGGQRQRIGIARALYSKCRIVFMDDPLSALDSHVALHVFQEGILRILMKQKRTVVLVTHHLQYLNFAHMIVVMNNGCVTHQGTIDEIKISDPEMYENWQKIIHVKHPNDSEPNKVTKDRQALRRMVTRECQCGGLKVKEPVEKSPRPDFMRQISITSQNFDPLPCDEYIYLDTGSHTNDKKLSIVVDTSALEESSIIYSKDDSKKNQIEKGKLISKEERAIGSVSWRMYVLYIKACSIFISLLTLVLTFAQQGTKIGTDFWLSEWASANEKASADAGDEWRDNYSVKEIVNNSDWIFQAKDTIPNSFDSNLVYYLTGYSLLSLTGITLALMSSGGFAISGIKAAKELHSHLITTIVQCPMRFFDITPLGRILNRFSSDMSVVDEKLGGSIYLMVRSFGLCLSGLIVNAIVTPIFLIPLLPFLIFYYLLQKFYRLSAIEVQRLDSISKSPLFAHFNESLGGLSTIRAYNAELRFKKKMLDCIDVNNTAFLFLHAINRWLGIRLDLIGDIIVFISALGSITVALFNIIPPSFVGLALTYSLQMSGSINWLVRTLTDTEMFMSSVERLSQYITLPGENYQSLVVSSTDSMQEIITINKAPQNWPRKGEVELKDVSLRYDISLDPVVRKITLRISAGEKVGICGRTGSGKSSLTLGLFRMIEICEGKIFLDGIDISTVPLLKLRSKIAIIPQDPVLFSGTIRVNLDIEHKYTDEELWHVLELSQLKYHISNLPHQLDTQISEGGENFSLGQKQLFCLARAILKNSQILVMDEATSSLDVQTDQIIQSVIEEKFADKTVISIAHRVTSLLNFDTIVVLDAGIIAEYGSPQKLLEKEEGIFTSLVRTAEK